MYEDTLNRPAKSLYFLRNGYYEVWKWYILYFLHIVCVVRLGIEAKRGENSTVLVYVCFFV